MRQWLVLVLALAAAGACTTPQAGTRAGKEGGPQAAARVARADSVARADAAARADALARAAALAERPRVYVDVRTPEEYNAGHLPQAVNIPVNDMEQRWAELRAYPDRLIVLYCRSGHRAGVALQIVGQHGIENATNGGGYENLRKQLEEAAN